MHEINGRFASGLYAIAIPRKKFAINIFFYLFNSKCPQHSHESIFICFYLQFTTITEKEVQYLQEKLELCLAQIRPNAVGIVDGFDIPDQILCSALGAYDGNVYERLYAEAQKSPLNQATDNKAFHLYLKPFLKSNL